MDTDLKKVRKTVDYLFNPYPQGTVEHDNHHSNLICVVNTTGTPYFKHQPLKDVVIWYGLSEGIRDGILKELAGNIQAFDFEGNVEAYLAYVIEDFFRAYGAAGLPDGTPAKLAIFFPQTDDVQELRPVIEAKLASLGLPPTLVLEHHTKNDHKQEFDRFKSKESQHRIALLVDRGVEGWNVPALFSCALARKLKSSNNFVLQATSRCLRQVPGNTLEARVYLSIDNRSILDKQLQETYGESISDLNHTTANSRKWTITLRKVNIPPLVVRKLVRTVVRIDNEETRLLLTLPQGEEVPTLTKTTYRLSEQPGIYKVLQQVGDTVTIESQSETVDLFAAAVDLSANYHIDDLTLYSLLKAIYPETYSMPISHLTKIAEQIEEQTRKYEIKEESVEVALALIKPDGFDKEITADGVETYTAEISYPVDRQNLLTSWEKWKNLAGELGFHYDPYNFDSSPERSFFTQLLDDLHQQPDDIEDIYFTGAISDPQKTDFYVEYKGEDNSWHRYTPDFIVRRKEGKCLIVEIKKEHDRLHNIDGETGAKAIATQKWLGLNPDLLKYQMIFTSGDDVGYDHVITCRQILEGS